MSDNGSNHRDHLTGMPRARIPRMGYEARAGAVIFMMLFAGFVFAANELEKLSKVPPEPMNMVALGIGGMFVGFGLLLATWVAWR